MILDHKLSTPNQIIQNHDQSMHSNPAHKILKKTKNGDKINIKNQPFGDDEQQMRPSLQGIKKNFSMVSAPAIHRLVKKHENRKKQNLNSSQIHSQNRLKTTINANNNQRTFRSIDQNREYEREIEEIKKSMNVKNRQAQILNSRIEVLKQQNYYLKKKTQKFYVLEQQNKYLRSQLAQKNSVISSLAVEKKALNFSDIMKDSTNKTARSTTKPNRDLSIKTSRSSKQKINVTLKQSLENRTPKNNSKIDKLLSKAINIQNQIKEVTNKTRIAELTNRQSQQSNHQIVSRLVTSEIFQTQSQQIKQLHELLKQKQEKLSFCVKKQNQLFTTIELLQRKVANALDGYEKLCKMMNRQ